MKGRLLSSAAFAVPPPPQSAGKGAKPIATIGTMQRDTTPEQRAAHALMKRGLKRAARNIRYQGLQEQEARDKP